MTSWRGWLVALVLLACGQTHRSGPQPIDSATGATGATGPSVTSEPRGGDGPGPDAGGAASAAAGEAGASLGEGGALVDPPVFQDPVPFVGPTWSNIQHVAFTPEHQGALCASTVVGDLDGDGFDDLMFVDSNPYLEGSYDAFGVTGVAYLFYGRADFPAELSALDADLIVRGAVTAARLGDIDGDGFPDAGLGAACRCEDFATNHYCECPSSNGAHVLFGGGAQRFSGEHRADLVGVHLQPQGLLVEALASAGDLDGDGAGEFALGVGQSSQVYGGSASLKLPASSAGPSFEVPGLVAAGDMDADGYDDLAAIHVSYEANTARLETRLFYGNAQRLTTGFAEADATFAMLGNEERLASIGDLDSDGYADLALPNPLRARFLYGRKTRFSGNPDKELRDFSLISRFGTFTSVSAADLNGDGLRDLLVSTKTGTSGGLLLLAGAAERLSGDLLVGKDQLVDLGNVEAQADYCLSNAGDVNGDGFEDIAVGMVGGGLWLLLGSPFSD